LKRYFDFSKPNMDSMQATILDLQSRVGLLEDNIGVIYYMSSMAGDMVNPPVSTNAWGTASMSLYGTRLAYNVQVHNLSSAITGANFYIGLPYQGGTAVENITFSDGIAVGTWDMDSNEINALKAGNLYLSVKTANFPNGEIMGLVRTQ
jgi:hypothetical protein